MDTDDDVLGERWATKGHQGPGPAMCVSQVQNEFSPFLVTTQCVSTSWSLEGNILGTRVEDNSTSFFFCLCFL